MILPVPPGKLPGLQNEGIHQPLTSAAFLAVDGLDAMAGDGYTSMPYRIAEGLVAGLTLLEALMFLLMGDLDLVFMTGAAGGGALWHALAATGPPSQDAAVMVSPRSIAVVLRF
jgi:hypothetical protein